MPGITTPERRADHLAAREALGRPEERLRAASLPLPSVVAAPGGAAREGQRTGPNQGSRPRVALGMGWRSRVAVEVPARLWGVGGAGRANLAL